MITSTQTINNENNVIESDGDEIKTNNLSINSDNQENENSIENNAFISNRGTRSNSTNNLERDSSFYSHENKSNYVKMNIYLIFFVTLFSLIRS